MQVKDKILKGQNVERELGFNTSKVQVKASYAAGVGSDAQSFNTSKVQVKVHTKATCNKNRITFSESYIKIIYLYMHLFCVF